MIRYKLKDLLAIKNGKDHKELNNGNIPIYGSGGIMRYGDRAIYSDESILLPRKGTLSNIQYVNKPFWTVDTIYYSIINKELANPFYLFNFLKSLDLSKLNTGTGVPSMTFDSYYNLEILLPELQDQQKIASVLSALDSKIELNNKINAELEAMAKTLYDYWFVQFDFPYDFASGKPDVKGKPYKSSGGKMVWNEVLKREVPEGWEAKIIGEFGEFKNGINYDPSIEGDVDAKIINVRNISSSNLIVSKYDLDTISLESSNVRKYLVTEYDILIARSGIPGATRMMFDYDENTIYCGFIIRFQVNLLSQKKYLFYCLKALEKIMTLKSGGTIMPSVNQNSLKQMNILLPNEITIQKFNDLMNPVFKQINNIINENHKLAELRDWLLPMLMNGQVSVGEVAGELSELTGIAAESKPIYK